MNVAFLLFRGNSAGRVVYLSLDANKGLYLSLLYCIAAVLKKKELILHHHTYGHIGGKSMAMLLINWLAGNNAIHLCICDKMGRDLSQQYPGVKYRTLNNAFLLRRGKLSEKKYVQSQITIGYLSRITPEKGADLVIDAACQLKKNFDGEVKVVLAGPVPDADYYKRLLRRCEGVVQVVGTGMIKGDEIDRFYESIDYFLFPTRYENETQGIVNIEALSHGVPSVAFARCCIQSDIGDGGLAVGLSQDFSSQAAGAIAQYHVNSGSYLEIRKKAIMQFDIIYSRSLDELKLLAIALNGLDNSKIR